MVNICANLKKKIKNGPMFFKVNKIFKITKQNKRHDKNNINLEWVYGDKVF